MASSMSDSEQRNLRWNCMDFAIRTSTGVNTTPQGTLCFVVGTAEEHVAKATVYYDFLTDTNSKVRGTLGVINGGKK